MYVKANLTEDIRKRMIMNGMTGSSWRFKRFERISTAVISDKIVTIGN